MDSLCTSTLTWSLTATATASRSAVTASFGMAAQGSDFGSARKPLGRVMQFGRGCAGRVIVAVAVNDHVNVNVNDYDYVSDRRRVAQMWEQTLRAGPTRCVCHRSASERGRRESCVPTAIE